MHQSHILQEASCTALYYRSHISEVNSVDTSSNKWQRTHPSHLVCEAGVGRQNGVSSYPVPVLQGLGSSLRLVSHQVGGALSGNVAALLLWEALPVVLPLLQGLVKGGMTHQA